MRKENLFEKKFSKKICESMVLGILETIQIILLNDLNTFGNLGELNHAPFFFLVWNHLGK